MSVADEVRNLGLKTWVELSEKIKRQDTPTPNPIVTVQSKSVFYGVEDGLNDGFDWIDQKHGYCDVPETRSRLLEALYQDGRKVPARYHRLGYKVVWEHVQTFFTVEAAEKFIQQRKYDYEELRIYARSGECNPEWQQVLDMVHSAPALLRAVNTLAAVTELVLAPKDPHKIVQNEYKLEAISEMVRNGATPVFQRVT